MTLFLALLQAISFASDLPITDSGNAVVGLVQAQPFQLIEPYEYQWAAHRPEVVEGLVIVLRVEPDFAVPRQVKMPVLYAGNTPVELVGSTETGCVVALVPKQEMLAKKPIFFGTTKLPEEVDAERGTEEMATALARGIAPRPASEWREALKTGGSTLNPYNYDQLHQYAMGLLESCDQ
ncbi:MAG: hypothetical protein HN348_08440 [Proteobacteria bacterium]|jgi:hypothetical protein|nr:hypothetical protein [Pseudomonadota bacterium]